MPMPVFYHFARRIIERRHAHSYLHSWATFLAADLNRALPEPLVADPNVHFGAEIDVAAFDGDLVGGGGGAVGVDGVTSRGGDLHAELMASLGSPTDAGGRNTLGVGASLGTGGGARPVATGVSLAADELLAHLGHEDAELGD